MDRLCCEMIISHGYVIVKYNLVIIIYKVCRGKLCIVPEHPGDFRREVWGCGALLGKIPLYEQGKVLYNRRTEQEVSLVHCLKCGRETEEGQSFCPECLLDMQKHPVDPNAVVLLPRRENAQPVKKPPRRRTLTAEERVAVLKRRNRWLIGLLVACLLACGALAYPAYRYLRRAPLRRGQNYTYAMPLNKNTQNVETTAP